MASPHEAQPASVVVEYNENDHLTTAHFTWVEGSPNDTYTIDVNRRLSIALDAQLPVRPYMVNLYDKSTQHLEPLTALVGEELTEAMMAARHSGALALALELSSENRLAIARLQFHSPSTSPRMRDATAVFIDERLPNPRLASHRHVIGLAQRAS